MASRRRASGSAANTTCRHWRRWSVVFSVVNAGGAHRDRSFRLTVCCACNATNAAADATTGDSAEAFAPFDAEKRTKVNLNERTKIKLSHFRCITLKLILRQHCAWAEQSFWSLIEKVVA